MGCDIHVMIEYAGYVKQCGTTVWRGFGSGHFNPGRDYTMFGVLAGVRDDSVEQIVSLRGLPEDKGYAACEAYDGDEDLHSHTWLSVDEYAQAYATRMMACGYGPPDTAYEIIMVTLMAFKERDVEARLLIAFDN